MKENTTHMHGGDLDAIERLYGIPKNEIVDFSGNINPLGFPESVRKLLAENINIVSAYPDKKYVKLRESIASYTGTKPEYVSVGNGSTELISVFIKSVNAKKTIIMGPAYSEYENAVSVTGGSFEYFPLKEENNFVLDVDELLTVLTDDIGLFVACNPNNPTGTAIETKDMERILIHCKEKGISVMIDETYIEFSDEPEKICTIPLAEKYDNVFVIRGISKFFAAPGLRLGYCVTSSPSFKSLLEKYQDPWSVNILAAFAGENLFKDTDFMAKTRKLILDEKYKFFRELENFKNLRVYPTSSNFILTKLLTDKVTAADIYEKLIPQKMLVRDASSFYSLDESFLRFCIMSPEDNARLIASLKKIIE